MHEEQALPCTCVGTTLESCHWVLRLTAESSLLTEPGVGSWAGFHFQTRACSWTDE